MSFGDLLVTRHCASGSKVRQKAAIVDGQRSLSFQDLNLRVNRLCHAVRSLGLKPDDRIALLAYNRSEHVEAYLAAAKGAFVPVPLNFRLTLKDLAFILNDSEAKALVVDEGHLAIAGQLKSGAPGLEHIIVTEKTPFSGTFNYDELLSSAPEDEPDLKPSADSLLFIMYTSGTTGTPKGVALTHRNNEVHTELMTRVLDLQDNEITLHVCPFFHIASLWIILTHLYRGCTNIILPKFDSAQVFSMLAKHPVTNMNLVPTMLYELVHAEEAKAYKIETLRLILYGAAPMPRSVLEKGKEIFGSIFAQVYGLTEASPVLTYLSGEDHASEQRLRSCGRAVPGIEIRVVSEDGRDVAAGQVGEISARGLTITPGYWRRPEETATTIRDGWLQTGDLATVDPDGYIYLVDRKKDMIISGGENIYCREVEMVLETHAGVEEAAVIGLADPKWGEIPEAWIVLSESGEATAGELKEWCRSYLAHYKVPKSFRFVSALPKSPSGKILKKEIRARAWSEMKFPPELTGD